MGAVNINNTGSGSSVVLSSDGTSLLLNGTAIGGGGSTLVFNNQTAAYTVVSGDAAKVINCTSGTFTVSLTAAATLGSGFNCVIWNSSATATDVITIDPNGAETIDGRTTIILYRGEGTQIVCNGTNWQTGNKKTMRGYAENFLDSGGRPVASGSISVAIGRDATSSGTDSYAIGRGVTASGTGSFGLGYLTSAASNYSSAIGTNSALQGSQTVTGAGAMALGGSYASGTDSFAANSTNNTSTYGAKGANSVTLGQIAVASGSNAVAIGWNSSSSGQRSVALGYLTIASGNYSYSMSAYGSALQPYSATIFGARASSNVQGKAAFGPAYLVALGTVQGGILVCTATTTDATPTVLTSDAAAVSTINQVILPNNTAFAFTGTVVARQSAAGGTASAAWKIEGLIRRESGVGTTTLVASTVTAISNVPAWTLALSADTTRGGLSITFTGAVATNIQAVATIYTTEITYD